ncbi:MAG: type II toxin-antitoxin system VapC family toxin [Proteobacteria bacterium]|nr:type II toxin-antitoxin system VapC family toxin [Pseudomonadota bacterium]
MIVVDTNIIAALFLDGRFTAAAKALLKRDPEWCTEPFALIEFGNVLATYERAGLASRADAKHYLSAAEMFLAPHLHSVKRDAALDLAFVHRTTLYDAHFLAVAAARNTRLITEDSRLRAAAPRLTLSLDDALRA